jgi:hypothetical protein
MLTKIGGYDLSNCKIVNLTEKNPQEAIENFSKEFELTFKTPERKEKITLEGPGIVKVSALV